MTTSRGTAVGERPDKPVALERSVPHQLRLTHEIPKPLDWSIFQRNCVVLFKAELNDPHIQEYGRSGQDQRGIDLLGRREGRDDHFVGIQCRLHKKPMRYAKILEDARAALTLQAKLRELIFATTAPNDTAATDDAHKAEVLLRAEGHDLQIVVYGWEQLQVLIAQHDVAYNLFFPAALATAAVPDAGSSQADLSKRVAAQVIAQMREAGVLPPPKETAPREANDEDPSLHGRIDAYRDLFRGDGEPVVAEKRLRALLDSEDLSQKPWARFRILTNLGAVALDLGREEDGARLFEQAYELRPTDGSALANLALARTIQERFDEAMDVCQRALAADPPAEAAIGYLLQAAGRSDWEGDPELLIPEGLKGSVAADIGLADFARRREVASWPQRVLEIAARHPDANEFAMLRATAVLSLAVDDKETVAGGASGVSTADLAWAADAMKSLAETKLRAKYANTDDLVAIVNNAAVLLRLNERFAEEEALLLAGLPEVGHEAQIRRLLALAQSCQDRDGDALQTLAGDTDPENILLRAQLLASADRLTEAWSEAEGLEDGTLSGRLLILKWRLQGEIALALRDVTKVSAATAALQRVEPDGITAALLQLRWRRLNGADPEQLSEELKALTIAAEPSLTMTMRYVLSDALMDAGLSAEASRLLEGHVDLDRPSPSASLYLRALADARRDEAFRAAIARAGPALRNNAQTRWAVATHAWNIRDLPTCLAEVERLLDEVPDHPSGRLLKIELLIRLNRSRDVLAELDKPIEDLAWSGRKDLFRIAVLLGHFGHAERAAALAYRLFLQHRDTSRAWMTLSSLVLNEGRGDSKRWDAEAAGADVAVDVEFEDSARQFFVIEPDRRLRKIDPESWEPDHQVVRAVTGLSVGDEFTTADGRRGKITNLRHKYVARLHYVMEHHQERFPEINGFRRIKMDVEAPGGLDELIEQTKARHDWITEEEDRYLQGDLPLAILAFRVGVDTIDAAAGLAAHGKHLKVAVGLPDERAAAAKALGGAGSNGCVLDLLTFWNAWRLGVLEVVRKVAGDIVVPQSVVDTLRLRQARFEEATDGGFKSVGYAAGGKLLITELPAAEVTRLIDDVKAAQAWLAANARVMPVTAREDLPEVLREQLQRLDLDMSDAMILALQERLLLLSDDLVIRRMAAFFGGSSGVWLHAVLSAAGERGLLDADSFVRHTAALLEAKQVHLGVTGPVLARGAALEDPHAQLPGPMFTALSSVLGGAIAEPFSHVHVAAACIQSMWRDPKAINYREPLTGHLLRQLVRERTADHLEILGALVKLTRGIPGVGDYIVGWMRGHFVALPRPRARSPRRIPNQRRRESGRPRSERSTSA